MFKVLITYNEVDYNVLHSEDNIKIPSNSSFK